MKFHSRIRSRLAILVTRAGCHSYQPSLFYSNCYKNALINKLQHRQCSSTQNFTDLKSFGRIVIKGSKSDTFNVRPIDPVENPDQNKAVIKSPCNVHVSEDGILSLDTADFDGDAANDVEIPMKYEIEADLQNGSSIKLSSMESPKIYIQTENGSCDLEKIKCDNVEIASENGTVTCKPALHANGKITANTGALNIGRLVGDKFEIQSIDGDLNIATSYVENLDVFSSSGNVRIGGLHRNAEFLISRGALFVDSLDGNMKVKVNFGDVTVGVTQHEEIDMMLNKGNVFLELPPSVDTEVTLSASGLDIDDDAFDLDQLKDSKHRHLTVVKGRIYGKDTEEDKDAKRTLKIVGDVSELIKPKRNITITTLEGEIHITAAKWGDKMNFFK